MAMQRPRWIVVTGAFAAAAAILFFFGRDSAPPVAGVLALPVTAEAPHRAQPPPVRWAADPMAAGSPAATPPAYVALRQKKMQALMTGSPPWYDTLSLKKLRELARAGDADAMMQLAEQYANEDGRLRADPDYPVGENTRELAKQYLSDAFLAGRLRAAALLSKQLFDDNQIGDAYAWRMVSEKLGDSVNPLWSGDTNQFAGLSDSEKAAAQAKATSLVDTLLQNASREFARAHGASR